MARKVVILVRECGLQLELGDLQVSSLVPQPLQGLASADAFMQQLPQVGGWVVCAAQHCYYGVSEQFNAAWTDEIRVVRRGS